MTDSIHKASGFFTEDPVQSDRLNGLNGVSRSQEGLRDKPSKDRRCLRGGAVMNSIRGQTSKMIDGLALTVEKAGCRALLLTWLAVTSVCLWTLVARSAPTGERGVLASDGNQISATATGISLISNASSEGLAVSVAPLAADKDFSFLQRFQVATFLEYSSSLHESLRERTSSVALDIRPMYKINDSYRIGARFALDRDTSSEAATTTFDNAKVWLIRTATPLTPRFSFEPAVSVKLPTNRFDVQDHSYRGSVGIGASFLFDLQSMTLPISGRVGFSGEKNSHEFVLSGERSPNIEYSLVEIVALTWKMARRWTLAVDGSFTSSWTYRGEVRNRFTLAQRIEYAASGALSFYVGHGNGDSALKANGGESNISIFDERTSAIHTGIGYVF